MSDSAQIYLMGRSSLDRHAYRLLLRNELHIEPIAESGFTPPDVWSAMRCNPRIALVETDSPDGAVIDCIAMIPRLRKETKILVTSAAIEPSRMQGWAGLPLDGYVVKDGGVAELGMAIRALSAGESYFSVGAQDALKNGKSPGDVLSKLSRREAELLPLLARGMALRDAAQAMTVSYKTADSYRTSLLRKLGVKDRVELARFAIRTKLVDP